MSEMMTYEGMFLLDATQSDFDGDGEPVRGLLGEIEAEVLALKPYDERKLAYEIAGKRRGLYVLTYFRADSGRIAELEHECQLHEKVLRLLVLRREQLSDEEVEAETPAIASSRRAEARAEARAEKAEQTPAPKTGAEPEAKPQSEAELEAKPQSEAEPEAKPQSEAEPESESEGKPASPTESQGEASGSTEASSSPSS